MQNLNLTQKIDADELKKIQEAGIELSKEKNSYYLVGHDEGVEEQKPVENFVFLPIKKALETYPWILEKYWWKLVNPEKDAYTREVFEDFEGGYFIWLKKGHKEVLPLQACFYIKESYSKQKVHNLIVLEEDSELHILNGCISSHKSEQATHLGITEIFVGKKAFLSYTMIHSWASTTEVYPRSAVKVEEEGQYTSNYIALKPTKKVQSYPTVFVGKNAKTYLNSIIFSHENSVYDVGGRAVLEAEGARAEVVSRSVSSGGEVIARAHIQSKADQTFGHMECSSLMLNKKGRVHAIPELESSSYDVTLSHEAMVGKIADEEVFYLMSRGLSEKEAVSLIVRGFLSVEVKGIPQSIKDQIHQTLELLENSNAL